MHESGPARGGIPFTVGGQTYTIHAKVSDIISDGDGHRQGLEWVGAGGMRCCFLHANVFGKLAAAQQRIQQLEAMTPFGEDFKRVAQQEAAEYTTIVTNALKDAEEATGSLSNEAGHGGNPQPTEADTGNTGLETGLKLGPRGS